LEREFKARSENIYFSQGVNSIYQKINLPKLYFHLDPKQIDKLDLISDETVWEVKTITSALKQFFR